MTRINVKLDPTRTGRDAEVLEAGLNRLVIGQPDAVASIVNIYQMHLSGMAAPGRPIGSFLFLGPTGSGKTRIVEATAETLLRDPRAAIKIDCAEFQHSHEIAKLIGSPPGYLGHRETHPLLSQEKLNQFHTDTVKLSLVLFDEIEKASDSLWNLLLGILDKATLTLGDNRKVDFSRAMIFMTSNLGAERMAGQRRMGFSVFQDELVQLKEMKMAQIGVDAARRAFKPEFLNRIDKTVVFEPLHPASIARILEVELGFVQQRVFNSSSERAFAFYCTDNAKELIMEQGFSIQYGARHLKRAMERLVVQPMSNLISTGQIKGGDCVRVERTMGADYLDFFVEKEGLSVSTMASLAARR